MTLALKRHLVTVYIYREKIRKNKKHKKYTVTDVTSVTHLCNHYSIRITEDHKGNFLGNTMKYRSVTTGNGLNGGFAGFFKKNIFALYK